MSEISITQAAFAGLKAIRAKPLTLIVWWVLSVVMTAGAMAVFAAVAGTAMADIQAIQAAGPNADPTAALGATGRMLGGVMAMVPIYLVISAVLTAAASRAVLRPDDGAPGYVRFGGDEFRMLVVWLVIGVIFFVLYIFGAFIGGLIAVASSGALSGGGAPDPAKMQPMILLGMSPFLLVMIFLAVKFSLAPAQTVDTRAINIFGSFGLTKGRFWKTLATYLLAGVCYAVIYAIGLGIVLGAWTAMGVEGGISKVVRPDLTSTAAVFAPPMLVYFLVMGLVGAIGLAFTACPAAAIYRQVTGGTQEEAF